MGLFRFLRFSFLLLVAVIFLIFAATNKQLIALNLAPFPYHLEIRLFAFTLLLLSVGFFCGWFIFPLSYLQKKQARTGKNKSATPMALEAIKEENARLRAIADLHSAQKSH